MFYSFVFLFIHSDFKNNCLHLFLCINIFFFIKTLHHLIIYILAQLFQYFNFYWHTCTAIILNASIVVGHSQSLKTFTFVTGASILKISHAVVYCSAASAEMWALIRGYSFSLAITLWHVFSWTSSTSSQMKCAIIIST